MKSNKYAIIIGITVFVLVIAMALGIFLTSNKKSNQNILNNTNNENGVVEDKNENNEQSSKKPNQEDKNDRVFEVLETKVHTPTIKLASGENSKIYGIQNKDEYDFYTIVVSAVITSSESSDTFRYERKVLTGVDNYYVIKHTTWLTDDEKKSYNYDTNNDICKLLYVIEYAIKKGTEPDINLVELGDNQIMSISKAEYKGNVIESGTAGLWDTIKIKDEYGTEHYLIPISSASYYNNSGLLATTTNDNGYAVSSYSFDLVQVGDCKNVPTDLAEVQKFYWNLEKINFSITYDGFKYVKYGSADGNNIVRVSDANSTDNITKLRRDNNIFEIAIQFLTKGVNETLFTNDNTLNIKISDVTLKINNIDWQ